MDILRARDYRQIAKEKLQNNWWVAVLVTLVASLLGSAITGSTSISIDEETTELIGRYFPALSYVLIIIGMYLTGLSLAQFILGGPITLGQCRYFLNLHEGQPASFKDLFSKFDRFGQALTLNILTNLYIILWSLLLIIPGVVASYRYSMAFYIMLEHPDWNAKECIQASSQLMKGNKWRLFCLDCSFIGWYLLSALTLGIGNLFINPYFTAARTAFYRDVCSNYHEE